MRGIGIFLARVAAVATLYYGLKSLLVTKTASDGVPVVHRPLVEVAEQSAILTVTCCTYASDNLEMPSAADAVGCIILTLSILATMSFVANWYKFHRTLEVQNGCEDGTSSENR